MTIEVAMQRDLRDLPLAAPLDLRPFRAGDESLWVDLQMSTGVYRSISHETFSRDLGTDRSLHEERIVFVERQGVAVATGAAWLAKPPLSSEWGRLHWIAVRPEFHRRGIGRALCLALLDRMRSWGHSHCSLTTGSSNQRAIRLYRSIGFSAFPRTAEEREYWEHEEKVSD